MKFIQKPDFVQIERDVYDFWENNRCFDKLREKNKHNKPFRFIDGPITANNAMGVHHVWGRSTKDIFLRYKAMNGHCSHYRNGFDSQGLWVEVEVEKELKFKDKSDILNYGLDNFTKKCVQRVNKYSGVITSQAKRLGQWMDFEGSYYTHTDENIGGIWHFLKVCHQRGWLTKAYRALAWCPRCGTSVSDHEMSGSYRMLQHTSVFVKLPIPEKDWDILVWTTTPWTLTANVALAVNPEIDYVLVQYEGGDKPLVLGKNALKVLQCKKTVLREIKGAELCGLQYQAVFPEFENQNFVHKIVPWDQVAADDGSGVVHIAPGCGAEDYDLGKRLGLPEICPVDEAGKFYDEYGDLAGIGAAAAAQTIFDKLTQSGKMYKTEQFEHSYPVCWRCKTEVIFRLVDEWYIKTEEIKPQLIAANNTVKWTPEYLGKRMNDWLENMGDWNISRKRFYGLPLPFYPCECGHLTVVGSKAELRELGGAAVDALPELHRPWVDEISITCPQCGKQVNRVSEVGDVWLDAGIVPFSTLGYFSDRTTWEKYYPIEWIVEMNEQVRLWFYSMLFMSVTLEGRAPYEKAMGHGMVVDEDGGRFNKTGYMITFDQAADKVGADAIRYLFAGTNIASNVRFGFNLVEEVKRKIMAFYNGCVFFMTYAALENPDVTTPVNSERIDVTDKWLVARMEKFKATITKCYDNFDTSGIIRHFEDCVEDLSNWYIRTNRRRFWKQGDDEDKRAAYYCLYHALKALNKSIAPIVPFLSDYIWQSMTRRFEPDAELSVHLSDWDCGAEYDEKILRDTDIVRDLITLAHKARNESQIKVKQPLAKMRVAPTEGNAAEFNAAIAQMRQIIADELNIKQIEIIQNTDEFYDKYLTLDFKQAGRVLKGDVQTVKQLLAELPQQYMAQAVCDFEQQRGVRLHGWETELPHTLFTLNTACKQGLSVVTNNNAIVALDINITKELAQQGLLRELLRQVQVMRKDAELRVEQRIRLGIKCDGQLAEVVQKFADKIMEETLSVSLNTPFNDVVSVKTLQVGDYNCEVTIGCLDVS